MNAIAIGVTRQERKDNPFGSTCICVGVGRGCGFYRCELKVPRIGSVDDRRPDTYGVLIMGGQCLVINCGCRQQQGRCFKRE
jgi:hypothetical protein